MSETNFIPSAENPFITGANLRTLTKRIKAAITTLTENSATKEEVAQAVANLTNVLTLQPGTVTKENLTTLADTAKVGQVFLVSDDANHFYVFLGKEAAGANENGFYDLGDHFDTSALASKEELTALSTTVSGLEPRVAANEAGVAKIDPLATRVTGIEDAIKKLEGGSETLGFTVFEDAEMQELWNSVVTD